MSKKRLKRFLSAALCGAILFAVAGCGSSTDKTDSTEKRADTENSAAATKAQADGGSSDEEVTLNLWHEWTIETDSNRVALDEAVAKYMEDHPNVKIETHMLENEAYKTKISTEFAGSASGIDVFFYWAGGRGGKLQKADKLLAIEDYLTEEQLDTIKPGSDAQFIYDDKLYTVPTYSWMMPLYCNTELFESAGVEIPTTYDELLDVCEKLKAAGVEVPLAMGIKDAWQAAFVYEAIALQEVGYENENKMLNGEIPFDDPGYLEAAEKTKKLYEAGAFGANPMEITASDADQLYLTGKAAMRMTGNWFTDAVYTDKNTVVQDITKAAQIPVFSKGTAEDYVGGFIDSFFINKNTANPDVAADFTMFLCKYIATARHESGQGFTAFTDPVDESGLQPVAKEVAAIANKGVNGIIAWDTALDENTALTHLEAVQSLFTDSGNPQAVFDDHQDAINK